MPATTPSLSQTLSARLAALGQHIRRQRKALRVSATVAAEAAGLSRVTLHRIESGNASVTMGAYLNVMAALGLDIAAIAAHAPDDAPTDSSATKAAGSAFKDTDASHAIRLADYPELRRLAWHVRGVDTLTPAEARGIYERHSRHLDENALQPHERQLIARLQSAREDAPHV